MKSWILALPLLAACGTSSGMEALTVTGSSTVQPPVGEAAEALREQGLVIRIDTLGGSSGGIAAVGEGRAQVGMSSKPLRESDRQRFPEASFEVHPIGADAVALVVSQDVWEAGVRAISAEAMRAIYEGQTTNWLELGGPDRRIAFYNKEPGRGTWGVFADWLYGDRDLAPEASFPEVGGNEETRNKVAGTLGALSQLSASWADGETVFALALEGADGPVAPTRDNIATSRYPMSRPLLLLTDGAPRGAAKELIDTMLSPLGQTLIEKHGYLGLARRSDPAETSH